MFYTDVDECVVESPCNTNAQCTNTVGSFFCVCNSGFQGDGMTCSGMRLLAQSETMFHCMLQI